MIIKHSPEDFIVEEVPSKDWDDAGPFAVFRLVKKGLNTEQAIEIIARKFHLLSNDIKYSGAKDKHAHTTQYVSIPVRNHAEQISRIQLDEDNLKLEHVGFTDEPLSLGTLAGNRFTITVREMTSSELDAIKNNKKYSSQFIVPNYFDEQRFSSNNYDIGLCILKKDYKGAVKHMCDSSDIFADSTRIFLTANPNDYVSALKRIPRKTLLMFIHSVQSFLFNEALYLMLSKHAGEHNLLHKVLPYSLGNLIYYDVPSLSTYNINTDKLPLIGFDTASPSHHISRLLRQNGLTQRDFIVRAIPDLSVEGTERDCFVEAKNLDIEILSERVIVQFELPKGSYATNVIKALFN